MCKLNLRKIDSAFDFRGLLTLLLITADEEAVIASRVCACSGQVAFTWERGECEHEMGQDNEISSKAQHWTFTVVCVG